MPSWTLPHLTWPAALVALVLIPLIIAVWWYASRQRRAVLQAWNDAYTLPPRRWLGRFLLLQILLLLILALAGPELGTAPITPTTTARDLLLIIDVSQSMLAEDQPPQSRLTRAKHYAIQLLDHLTISHSTTRVGIAVFAGKARLLCPPTEDHDHLQHLLHDLDTESLGMQGRTTDSAAGIIGTSFAALAQLLTDWSHTNPDAIDFTDYLILSDGDDLSGRVDSAPFIAARVPFYALAIGDDTRDWPIPQGNQYLMTIDPTTNTATRALTRRRDETLRTLTDATHGSLILEDNSPQPVIAWWQRTISTLPGRIIQTQQRTIPLNQGAWLLTLGVILLFLELAYGGPRRRDW